MSTCSSKLLKTSLCLLMAFAAVASTGCSTIRLFDEQAALTYRDFVWGKRAYNLRYGRCDRPYSEHFRNGFCAGYADICNGGDGYVPALPPDSYRSYEYQSADGAKCVNAWFEGYPAGVAAAKQDKTGTYHDIMVSRMIDRAVKQDNSKGSLPTGIETKADDTQQAESKTVVPNTQPRPISPVNPMPSVVSPINDSTPESFSLPSVTPAGFQSKPEYGGLPIFSRSWQD